MSVPSTLERTSRLRLISVAVCSGESADDEGILRTEEESLKAVVGIGRGAGSWSSGYDIALTWRRSPVRIRSSPLDSRLRASCAISLSRTFEFVTRHGRRRDRTRPDEVVRRPSGRGRHLIFRRQGRGLW